MATCQGDVQQGSGKEEIPTQRLDSADTIKQVQGRKENKGAIIKSRRRAAKGTAQDKYTEANKAVKNSVKYTWKTSLKA